MAKSKFDQALKLFIDSQTTAMEAARICAELGIQEYAKSGNLTPLQSFHDAMDKNFSRRSAFLKWLVAHAPVMMVKGTFKKSTDEAEIAKFVEDGEGATVKCHLTAALEKPFWDFDPPEQIVNFSASDLDKAILAVIKRFENSKHNPADEAAATRIRVIKERLQLAA